MKKEQELTKEDMKDIIKDIVKERSGESHGTSYENFDQTPTFSHQQNIHHDRHKFYLDFQNCVLNFDAEHKGNMITNHKLMILDPFVVKSFCEILASNIKKYEDAYGVISMDAIANNTDKTKRKKPDYLG